VDQTLINRKVDSLLRCIQRIQTKCPSTAGQLKEDVDAQDVIVLNLSRAVQLCVDIASHCLSHTNQPIPNTMGEAFQHLAASKLITPELALRLRKSVGFRNLAVHNYHDLNWEIVFAVATKHLDDFLEFAQAVSKGN
jgi:uncharacterized protein YutE (UPF0331/DUF86 family)